MQISEKNYTKHLHTFDICTVRTSKCFLLPTPNLLSIHSLPQYYSKLVAFVGGQS